MEGGAQIAVYSCSCVSDVTRITQAGGSMN